jgi:hypothetical protein
MLQASNQTTTNETTTEQIHDKPALTQPALLLRLEAAAVFAAIIATYIHLGGNGWLFVALLLAPDLAMLGYLANKKVGAWTYNLAHFYAAPGALLALSLIIAAPLMTQIALIWLAHIAMDRVVGYGFKYVTDFKDTHLSRV